MSDSSQDTGCRLCGLPVGGRKDGFCCIGCAHVYAILSEILEDEDPESMRQSDYYRRMQEMGVIPRDGSTPEEMPQPEIPAPVIDMPGEEVESQVFRVDGMWCPSCSWVIERVLEKQDGVLRATASYHSDRVKVEYLPRLVGSDTIVNGINGLGYSVVESGNEQAREKRRQRDLIRLGIAIFFSANVMMFSLGLYQGFFTELSRDAVGMVGLLIFLMATVVVFVGGYPILNRAVRAALNRAFVMETLTSLGALAAYFLSVVHLLQRDLHMYFDTASMLTTLVLLGKYIERTIQDRAASGIEEIYALVPQKGRRVMDDREMYMRIDAIEKGDLLRVLAGEMIPADGRVESGQGVADESKLTGETAPRRKNAGDALLGGSTLESGDLTFRVSAKGPEAAIGRMVSLMEEALTKKNPFERFADRMMTWFVPAIILLATIAAGTLLYFGATLDKALVRAVTVLVIACPCALGIATPLAKVAAVGRARKLGILVTDADALETGSRLTAIVMDKTGTVTMGDFQVLDQTSTEDADRDWVEKSAALEGQSDHPIARAIRQHASGNEISVEDLQAVPGQGMLGSIESVPWAVGNRRFISENFSLSIPPEIEQQLVQWESRGLTTVLVADEKTLHGAFALGDDLRPDMAETVAALKKLGIALHLVSGDAQGPTKVAANALGIEHYAAETLPDGKVAYLRDLQSKGQVVGMVGDGANDAASLAAADLGLATGDALTVAKHASDMTLMSFSGSKILDALALSQLAVRSIRTNLALALIYNFCAIPLALFGLVNPILAVSLMLMSSLTVVTNSYRISRG